MTYNLPQNGGSFYTSTESEVLIDPFVSPPQMQSQLTGELTRYEDLVRRDFRYAHLVAGASKMPMNMIWVSRNQGGDVNDQDLAALRDVAWTEFVKKRFLPSVAEGSSVAEAAASMLEIVRSMNLQRRRFQIMGLHEQVEASELQLVIHLCQAGLLHTGDYRVTANRFRRHDKFFEAFALAVGAFVCSSAPFTMGVATTQLNRSLQFEYKKQTTALFVYVLQENRSLVNQTGFGFDEDYVARIARFIIVSQDDSTTAGQLPPPKDEGGSSSRTETFIRGALESVQRQADRVERLAAQMDRDADRGGSRSRGRDSGVDGGRVGELIRRALADQKGKERDEAVKEARALQEESERRLNTRYDGIVTAIREDNLKTMHSVQSDNQKTVRDYGNSVARMEALVGEIKKETEKNIALIKSENSQTNQNLTLLIHNQVAEVAEEYEKDKTKTQEELASIGANINAHQEQQTEAYGRFKEEVIGWLQYPQHTQDNVPSAPMDSDLCLLQYIQEINELKTRCSIQETQMQSVLSKLHMIEGSNSDLTAQIASMKLPLEGNSLSIHANNQKILLLEQALLEIQKTIEMHDLYVKNTDFTLYQSDIMGRFQTINGDIARLKTQTENDAAEAVMVKTEFRGLKDKLEATITRHIKQEGESGVTDAKLSQVEAKLIAIIDQMHGTLTATLTGLNAQMAERTKAESDAQIEAAIYEMRRESDAKIAAAIDEIKREAQNSAPKPEMFRADIRGVLAEYLGRAETLRDLSENIAGNTGLRQEMEARISVMVGQHFTQLSEQVHELKGYISTHQSTAPNFRMFSDDAALPPTAVYAPQPP